MNEMSRIESILLSILMAMFLFINVGYASGTEKTLILEEDWHLSSSLDINAGEDNTIIIDGQGKYKIYEMSTSAKLINSTGTVRLENVEVINAGTNPTVGSLAELSKTASSIKSVTAPERGATTLKMPTVSGFTVSIKSSSNEAVIATDGTITTPTEQKIVKLVFTVSGTAGKADTNSISVTVLPKDKIKSLSANYKSLAIKPGDDVQVTLTAVNSDNTTTDVTALAVWSSEDTSIATVDAGLITSLAAGKTKITAQYDNKKVSISFNSLPSSISASVSTISYKPGEGHQVYLYAIYPDKSQVDVTGLATWTSSNEDIATVGGGIVYAVSNGKASITAAYGGKKIKISFDNSIKSLRASVSKISYKPGEGHQVYLYAIYPDNSQVDVTELATWTSSNTDIVTIGGGIVYAVSNGKASITAVYGGKKVKISFDSSISSLSANASTINIKPGEDYQVHLYANYADDSQVEVTEDAQWVSKKTDIATVNRGVVTAVANGKTTITATYAKKKVNIAFDSSFKSLVSDTNSSISISQGENRQLRAFIKYPDDSEVEVTNLAVWTSSKSTAATVVNGLVTAVKAGKAVISIKYGGKTIKINVTVM